MNERVAIIYATSEGHTADIADRVASRLRAAGHEVSLFEAGFPPATLDGFAAVLVAGSVHAGRHDRALVRFASDHRDELAGRTTAFISVSLSAASDDTAAQDQARRYVDDFIASTGWQPSLVSFAGGMLAYTQYGFIKRQLVRQVARAQHLETDTSRDWDHTDWPAIERFIAEFECRLSKPCDQSSKATA